MSELEVSGQNLKELGKEVLTDKLTKIDASDNALTVLGAEIGACTALEELLLFANQLKVLPKELGSLANLRVLNLFNNKLMKLPVEVGTLSNLEEVNLAANKLMMLPDAALASWSKVTILSMNDNNLVRLGSLAPLKALTELRLFSNNLEEMPTFCEDCPVEIIEIHKNRIATIPDNYFSTTPSLKRVIVSNNMLTTVPPSISKCTQLQQLQASDCKISSLPEGVEWPPTLETVFLQGNEGLAALPAELAKLPNIKRCNLGAAGPVSIVAALQDLALEKPDGIFWDSAGKMIKPEDRPKKAAAPAKEKSKSKEAPRAASPGKPKPAGSGNGSGSARGASPKRAASPPKKAGGGAKAKPK